MENTINYKSAQYIVGSVGTLGGLYYAFSKNKGFWGYIGFALLGGLAGSIIGGLYDNAVKPSIKSLSKSDNDVKNDLAQLHTTRPMVQSPISAESEAMDTQMKNFL